MITHCPDYGSIRKILRNIVVFTIVEIYIVQSCQFCSFQYFNIYTMLYLYHKSNLGVSYIFLFFLK